MSMIFQSMIGSVAFAEMNTQERVQLISVLPDWHAVTYTLSKEDVAFVTTVLQKQGKTLSSPLGIENKNGKLFVSNKEIKFEKDGKSINYNGIVVAFDHTQSFQTNYEKIHSRLSGKSAMFEFFIHSANATGKSDAAEKFAGASLTIAVFAYMFDAPKKVIVGALVVAALFGAVSVAYAEEITNIVGFECQPYGYDLKMRDGSTLKTKVENGTGAITVTKVSKDGKSQELPGNARISKVAPPVRGACLTGKLSNEEIKAVIDKANSNAFGPGVNGTAVK